MKKINLQTNNCLNHVVSTTLQHVYPPMIQATN